MLFKDSYLLSTRCSLARLVLVGVTSLSDLRECKSDSHTVLHEHGLARCDPSVLEVHIGSLSLLHMHFLSHGNILVDLLLEFLGGSLALHDLARGTGNVVATSTTCHKISLHFVIVTSV